MSPVKSATIVSAGERAAGLPEVHFTLSGGDYIFDPDVFDDPLRAVEEFRANLKVFAEMNLCDGPVGVYLEGYDR